MGNGVYYFRRVIGIVLYGLAYAALWPGLTHPMVSLQGNAAFWSNGRIGVGLTTSDEFLKPRSRSTVQLIMDLLESKYYFPFAVLFLFSVVSPVLKLLVLLYGEIKGNIFRIRVDGYKESSMVDLRKGLRLMSKYQCVDVFVAIITRELLNSDFIQCDVLDGFYYFMFYSFMSILASQVIDAHPHASSDRSPVSGGKTSLDGFLLFCSISMFAVGLTWSLGFPILAVKFLFQSKIVIGETVASLSSFLIPPSTPPQLQDSVCAAVVLVTVVFIPALLVLLASVVQCCDSRACSGPLRSLARILADWALADVFAVALLTCLFSFSSFSVLRTSAPWGFYCVLMAAMSAFEIAKTLRHVPSSPTAYLPIAHKPLEEVPMEEFGEVEQSSSSSGDEKGPFGPVSPRSRRKRGTDSRGSYQRLDRIGSSIADDRSPVVIKSGLVHVIVTITKRLGLPFFLLKALGWAIFFIVWYMNSGAGSLDLTSLSSTLQANVPLVSAALQTSLPFGIGMCPHLAATENVTFVANHTECISKPHGLHYEKHTAYEVLARWMSGFPSVGVTEMRISVPSEKKFLLSVSGQFSHIKLSLFVGQCLANFFDDDSNESESAAAVPACSKVFDSVHHWTNVGWSINVRADCSVAAPYVRNIVVDQVKVTSPMKVEEEIAFGLSIPLDDLADHFRDGLKESIEPLLTKSSGWIPWGPRKFDLVSLLSHLVELNVDSHGGTLQVSCPQNFSKNSP